uniref:Uncharacterized protein n=1 Tax=Triticum urartu TaxID=4572 RepID=A0A8R7R188_TRIUA
RGGTRGAPLVSLLLAPPRQRLDLGASPSSSTPRAKCYPPAACRSSHCSPLRPIGPVAMATSSSNSNPFSFALRGLRDREGGDCGSYYSIPDLGDQRIGGCREDHGLGEDLPGAS